MLLRGSFHVASGMNPIHYEGECCFAVEISMQRFVFSPIQVACLSNNRSYSTHRNLVAFEVVGVYLVILPPKNSSIVGNMRADIIVSSAIPMVDDIRFSAGI